MMDLLSMGITRVFRGPICPPHSGPLLFIGGESGGCMHSTTNKQLEKLKKIKWVQSHFIERRIGLHPDKRIQTLIDHRVIHAYAEEIERYKFETWPMYTKQITNTDGSIFMAVCYWYELMGVFGISIWYFPNEFLCNQFKRGQHSPIDSEFNRMYLPQPFYRAVDLDFVNFTHTKKAATVILKKSVARYEEERQNERLLTIRGMK